MDDKSTKETFLDVNILKRKEKLESREKRSDRLILIERAIRIGVAVFTAFAGIEAFSQQPWAIWGTIVGPIILVLAGEINTQFNPGWMNTHCRKYKALFERLHNDMKVAEKPLKPDDLDKFYTRYGDIIEAELKDRPTSESDDLDQ